MLNLIAYRMGHITPMQHDWLRSLVDIVENYFVYVQIFLVVFPRSNNVLLACFFALPGVECTYKTGSVVLHW